MLREGMFIADRYEILEKIGSGGMSDVYKAKCHKLNRYVAIKVLKPEFSEDKNFVSKFRVEAQSAAGLMHSNIVNVYDVGDEDGIHYIVMELVEGITLKKYIEKKGRLGVKEAVSIAIQVGQGIEAAHNHHIVHRDIKPQNIIISKEGKVKVTDFGIARAASTNTINSSAMGSVHYISPEQARGGYSDEKSDIYSFGITLFEMLTGKVPFEGDSTVAVALQHIQDDMVSPSSYVSNIPISVEKIVLKCTQKRTDRRYQTMTDLIADLKRSLVTPDEDFVVIAPAISSSAPTRMISDDELAQINEKASRTSTDGLDVIPPVHNNNGGNNLDDDDNEFEKVDPDSDDLLIDDDDDDDDDEENASQTKMDKIITAALISVGVIIIIIIIVILAKMVGIFNSSSSGDDNSATTATTAEDGKIEVPYIIGKTFDEAKEELNDLKLGIKPTYEYSSLYPEGQIFKQDIEKGERVEANTTINVVISKGAESFSLPDVIGHNEEDANSILNEKDLAVKTDYEFSEDVEVGKVIRTDPQPGTTVSSGDEIKIVVSQGSENKTAEVPNIVGKTESEARKMIEAAGFKVSSDVGKEFSNDVPEGSVISQSGPKAGEQAEKGKEIGFVLSKGKEPEESKPQETPAPVEKSTHITVTYGATNIQGLVPDNAYGIQYTLSIKQNNTTVSPIYTSALFNSKSEITGLNNQRINIDNKGISAGTGTLTLDITYKYKDDAQAEQTGSNKTSDTVTINEE